MYQQSIQTNTSEFVRTENKARLWKILQSNGAFNGIDNNFFTEVRQEFENSIQQTQTHNMQKTTMEKCKIFIDMMVEKMKQYKYVPVQNNTTSINAIPETNEELPPYTSEKIRQSRLDAFDNELNKKQSEFNQYNTKPTPPKVDFADKEDDVGDVNKLLEKAMRERENLNLPMPPKQSENNSDLTVKTETSQISNETQSTQSSILPTIDNNTNELLAQILERLTKIEDYITKERASKN